MGANRRLGAGKALLVLVAMIGVLALSACNKNSGSMETGTSSGGNIGDSSLLFDKTTNGPNDTGNMLPQPPANRWPVNMIDDAKLLYPNIPPYRTSNDGRVAMALSESGGKFDFYLFVPEKATVPVMEWPAGHDTIMWRRLEYNANTAASRFHSSTKAGSTIFQTFCDGTLQNVGQEPSNPSYTPRRNPERCSFQPSSDCYYLDVITAYGEGFQGGGDYAEAIQFYGQKIRVQVDNPKTPQAKIAGITFLGTPTAGARFAGVKAFFEPMITEDGKLLVGRLQESNVTLNGNTRLYDLVYSYNKKSPCDVTGWNKLSPVSHMHQDSDLWKADGQPRYEVARYRFRDTEGTAIPDGEDIGGTYPWIDRKGRNLFFMTVDSTLYDTVRNNGTSRYTAEPSTSSPFTSPPGQHGNAVEQGGHTRGISVIGGWTHGKLVLLDGILNNTDYGLGANESDQRWLRLYAGGAAGTCLNRPNNPSCVKVGAGRETSRNATPAGSVANINVLDSMENLFNYLPQFQPSTPRDVVWLMNTGRGSAEVVFDDYIDPHVFIYSDMTASLTYAWRTGAPKPKLEHNDGYTNGVGFNKAVRLQNAATSPLWNIPRYGAVSGAARIEPIALGGFQGKGLWMKTGMSVDYTIGAQSQSINDTWFISLFVDSREAPNSTRISQLLTFPDGSSIQILGRKQVQLVSPNRNVLKTYNLPEYYQNMNSGWGHFGFRIANATQTRVRFYWNGIPTEPTVWSYPGGGGGSDPNRIFRFTPGRLVLGNYASGTTVREGLYGWIDEFKVVANEVDPETFCNYAGGSLISPSLDAEWSQRRCVHNYAMGERSRYFLPSSVHRIKENAQGLIPLRNRVHTRDKDLDWNRPRPNFSNAAFCLSCHIQQHAGPLGLDALTANYDLDMFEDRRRQPVHPFSLVFGNRLGIMPAGAQRDPVTGGFLVDPWTFPDLN